MTEYTHTALKVSTKEQLDFLSEVSGLSRAKILEMVLGNIFEVASSFETLYFDFEGLRPRLPVPLENTDPNRVRKALLNMLAEDTARVEEPMSDWFARILKL